MTLAEALPLEMDRVRKVIAVYRTVPNGALAALLMEADLTIADQAIADGDVIAMLLAYETLKEVQL